MTCCRGPPACLLGGRNPRILLDLGAYRVRFARRKAETAFRAVIRRLYTQHSGFEIARIRGISPNGAGMMANAVLYDSTICVGCRECERACAERWKNPYNDRIAAEEKISAHKLTTIKTYGERYSRRMCMHCADPTCASVCPVGAFTKTALGPWSTTRPSAWAAATACRHARSRFPPMNGTNSRRAYGSATVL